MKRILVIGLPVVLLLMAMGCTKEKSVEEGSGSAQYYIECNLGGIAKTFNISAAATKADLGSGTTSYSVFGKTTSDAANLESFGFNIQLSIPFTAGTYKETDPTTDYLMAAVYNPNTTDATKIYATLADTSEPFQITLSAISSTQMEGTFKGRMFLNISNPQPDSIMVTNGRFRVKIQ